MKPFHFKIGSANLDRLDKQGLSVPYVKVSKTTKGFPGFIIYEPPIWARC